MFRLLLNPDADGGAGETGPAPSPASAPAAAKKVELTLEDFEVLSSYRARVAELETAEAQRAAEAARAQEAYLIEKGKYEEAIKIRDERYAREVQERESRLSNLERTFRATLLEKEVTTALASFPLVPGAAKQLTTLLRPEFEVIEAGGQFRVQTRTLESVSEFLKSRLNSSEYEHFLKPSGTAGTGAAGAHQTLPNHRQAPPPPATPDEQIFAAWRSQQAQMADAGYAARGLKGAPLS